MTGYIPLVMTHFLVFYKVNDVVLITILFAIHFC